MSKTGSANGSLLGNFIYDQLLHRRPHFLHDLSRAVNFAFVKEALKDFYVDWGRDPWDPVLMFKMVFLQFLYDLSDREIEERATWDLAFKYFLGLSAEELPPDHTTLCRFRMRLGAEGFQKLFNQVVAQAREKGLVSDRLHIIDATHIRAKVDLLRLKKEHRHGDDDDHYVDRHSPDPDARFGRKTPKKGFYGYKCHVAQGADSEFIVQVQTTQGNVPDSAILPCLAQSQAQELTEDKAYDSKANPTWPPWGWLPVYDPAGRGPDDHAKSWQERPQIERKFAECKQFHGLARARYWGLVQVTIQTLMVALVVNLKRWVTLFKLRSPALSWAPAA
ncbi:MAG: transposase [Syntrophobacterales bacterium]|nr:transposase [Syntrophobacterales bacterium]